MPRALSEAIVDGGIQNTFFFEGQVLTASALTTEQAAQRAHRREVGRAIGYGVLHGLEVKVPEVLGVPRTNLLAIEPGRAINRKGDVLHLPQREEVMLADLAPPPSGEPGDFDDCVQPEGDWLSIGKGAYVLVLSPASAKQGRAQKVGLSAGTVSSCGARYEVEGVRFRLLPLALEKLSGLSVETQQAFAATKTHINQVLSATPSNPVFDAALISRTRNLLAHACFGTESLGDEAITPLPAVDNAPEAVRYTALDQLDSLDDCDVPLGVVYWADRLVFADMWSARRLAYQDQAWQGVHGVTSPRRRAEVYAMIRQFEAQLGELLATRPSPQTLRARDYFRYLPPFAALPLAHGASRGLDEASFLDPLPHRSSPQFIDQRELAALLELARDHAPIDIAPQGRDSTENQEMLWVYRPVLRDSSVPNPALPDHPIGRREAPLSIITSAFLPPAGIARFDLARWDFGNYQR